MARVNPPTITPAPLPAPQRGDRATFSDRVDAFVLWLTSVVPLFNGAATATKTNADDAFASAEEAALQAGTAVSAANATAWVSGTIYTVGKVVYSPIDKRSYRRSTAGGGTTDPSLDKTNWVLLSHTPYALVLLATITPTASANVDFLNVFSAACDNYVVMIDGIKPSATDSLRLRFAVAGAPDVAENYFAGSNTYQTSTSVTSAAANPTTGFGVHGSLAIYNANDTLSGKALTAQVTSDSYEGAVTVPYKGLAALSGLRLYWSNGALFAPQGRIRVYGYVNSNS